MKPNDQPSQINLPLHWTPEQASAVFEFLISIAETIHRNFGEEIYRYSEREANGPLPQDWDHDCSIRDFLFPQLP